jgi:hypothetical protein
MQAQIVVGLSFAICASTPPWKALERRFWKRDVSGDALTPFGQIRLSPFGKKNLGVDKLPLT